MLMPGRQMNQGVNIPGATVTGNTVVNGYTVPVDLAVSSRTGILPSEYVASSNVEFSGEFESTISDEFVAYISDAGYAGTGNLGAGLSGSGGSYRYGFNGKENDNEVKGIGNQQDYGERIYDPRVSRFLSVDPFNQTYPWYTPYQFAGNTPIQAIDRDGSEPEYVFAHSTIQENKRRMTPDQARDYERNGNKVGMAYMYATFLLPLDAMTGFNGHRIGTTLFTTYSTMNIFEYTNRNSNQKDPNIRAENNQRVKGEIVDLALGYAIGKISGRFFNSIRAIATKRVALANNFYKEAGITDDVQRASHLNGIDFSKEVQTVTYKKGTTLEQWTYLDANGNPKTGNYYTLPGTDPKTLGIPLEGRVKTQVVLQEETNFLKSTASEVENWNKPGSGEMLQGGGNQLFNTKVKAKLKKP
jgi:RHS repeat-associated protein